MKKKPIYGIVIWKDITSSEKEQDFPLCPMCDIGLITYVRKEKNFYVLAEFCLAPGDEYETKIYKTKIPKANVELIIPLKIDLPELPQNLSAELVKLLKDNGLLNL